jgi:membrane protease YdiL (CAAX protease family)
VRTPSRIPDRLAQRLGPLLAPASSPYHQETPQVQRRRRIVVTVTLVVGTVLLGFALTRPQGSQSFYVLAGVLAAAWLVGGLLSGPVHLGRGSGGRRQIGWPILLGALAFGVFAIGAEAVSWIPSLHHAVDDIIKRADSGSRALIDVITIVNGIGEEVFFRGAVYSAYGQRRPVLWTTVTYVIVTAAAGNLMLVLAAALMGTLFALQRRATRGVLAPAITHVVWSTMMIFLLPR